MDDINMSIGEVLKERRIELSIKQEDLAERMNVTVQTVSKWERGFTEPKASQVANLAIELKLNEKEICQGKRNNNESIAASDFIKNVSRCIHNLPEIDLLITMYEEIENTKDFMDALSLKANLEPMTPELEAKEQAEHFIELYENGSLTFDSDEEKKYCLAAWERIKNS
ncbi:MAG: helix-turn-helix domain-containing protein [Vibrio sp.]